MGSFTKDLYRRDIGITNQFEIIEPISFYSEKVISGLKIKILPGFISDGDSTPWFLKPMVRASARRYQRSYVLHDGLFRLWGYYNLLHPKMEPLAIHQPLPTIKESNLILDESLEVLHLGRYPRAKVYYGLQLCGSPGTIKNLERVRAFENAWEFVELELFENLPPLGDCR